MLALILTLSLLRATTTEATPPPAPTTETAVTPPQPPPPPKPTGPLLKDGDRLVFLGDSITVAHTSMRYVEAYFKLRHPELTLTFINSGIGGHTAYDGLLRFDTDVAAYKPTVVVINFGMNDASYPEAAEGYAFEKNMGAIFDKLKGLGVRLVVWADTTPYDTQGLGPQNKNSLRERRIEELCTYAHEEGARRGFVVVDWHEPVKQALATWRHSLAHRADEKGLLPDRVHPAAPAHAVMAAQLISALGYPLDAAAITGAFKGGALTVRVGTSSTPKAPAQTQAWDGQTPLVLDVHDAAPVPLVISASDATDLSAPALATLRSLQLRLGGLPAGRYRVRLGDVEAGVFSERQLREGVDVMPATRKPPPPLTNPAPPEPRPKLLACRATTGNPLQNDFDCLVDLLLEKDALRVSLRHEKTRTLPDYVPGYLDRFWELGHEWMAAVDADVTARARALRTTPKTLTLTPER